MSGCIILVTWFYVLAHVCTACHTHTPLSLPLNSKHSVGSTGLALGSMRRLEFWVGGWGCLLECFAIWGIAPSFVALTRYWPCGASTFSLIVPRIPFLENDLCWAPFRLAEENFKFAFRSLTCCGCSLQSHVLRSIKLQNLDRAALAEFQVPTQPTLEDGAVGMLLTSFTWGVHNLLATTLLQETALFCCIRS